MTKIMNDGDHILQNLMKCFFRGSLNILLQPEDVHHMSWDWQQKFIDATVNSELNKKYPISTRFTRLYLKKIIEHLNDKQEIHDDFYTHLCHTMNNGETGDSFCYRHYLVDNQTEIITIKETNKMVVNGTTGMRTWEAGLMLADWALCHREIFTNKNILELGSGVGFTGITIAKLCQPKNMYLSDCHPDVMKAIHDNIKINFPQTNITENKTASLFRSEGKTVGSMVLDWNTLEDFPNDVTPDIVIGADIVYDPSILQPLCDVLKLLFSRNNEIDVYIASVIRNEETFQSFLKFLDNLNFTYQKLSINESVFIEWDHTVDKCLLKINFVSEEN